MKNPRGGGRTWKFRISPSQTLGRIWGMTPIISHASNPVRLVYTFYSLKHFTLSVRLSLESESKSPTLIDEEMPCPR
jgi:hypothetical protein